MIAEYALKAEDVLAMMRNPMEEHLSLKTEGYRCTTSETLQLLLKVVTEGSSLEAVCADTWEGIAGNTLREQLNAALDVAQYHRARHLSPGLGGWLASLIPPPFHKVHNLHNPSLHILHQVEMGYEFSEIQVKWPSQPVNPVKL